MFDRKYHYIKSHNLEYLSMPNQNHIVHLYDVNTNINTTINESDSDTDIYEKNININNEKDINININGREEKDINTVSNSTLKSAHLQYNTTIKKHHSIMQYEPDNVTFNYAY
eukprot:64467_1